MDNNYDSVKEQKLSVDEGVPLKSEQAIERNVSECEDCKTAEEQINSEAEVKKKKRKRTFKVLAIVAAVVTFCLLLKYILIGGVMVALCIDSCTSKVEAHTDISEYEMCIGEGATDNFRNKCEMDESIFPERITDGMNVVEFKSLYYNPWDPQYLSYLTVDYNKDDYDNEIARLSACPQMKYKGLYGADGFNEKYSLAAMVSDPYYGFVYALTDGESRVIYVEIIFCNYFMNLKYEKEIPAEYLPKGFDATMDNPYCEKMMNGN